MNFRGGSRGGAREPKTFFCQLAKYRQNEKKILDSPKTGSLKRTSGDGKHNFKVTKL
jgi:hypothetical protein